MELPRIRRTNDVFMSVKIKNDDGQYIPWCNFENIRASMYSEEQRASGGACDIGAISENGLELSVKYSADHYQFFGVNSLQVTLEYIGLTVTLKAPVCEFTQYNFSRHYYEPLPVELTVSI